MMVCGLYVLVNDDVPAVFRLSCTKERAKLNRSFGEK